MGLRSRYDQRAPNQAGSDGPGLRPSRAPAATLGSNRRGRGLVQTVNDISLAKALIEFPAGFMEPVYIGDPPLHRLVPACATGTATLLRLGERFLAVTCHHVLQAYRDLSHRPRHFQIGELLMEPENQLLSESKSLDLAVIRVHESQILDDCPGPGLHRLKFFGPRGWPPDPTTTEDVVSFSGFPGAWREQDTLASFVAYMFGHGAARVHAVSGTHFVTRLELGDCRTLYSAKEVGDIGGMSGGPVFRWRRHQLEPQLVGVIYEYQSTYDLLYVRSTKVIRSDGTIDDAAA